MKVRVVVQGLGVLELKVWRVGFAGLGAEFPNGLERFKCCGFQGFLGLKRVCKVTDVRTSMGLRLFAF